MTREDAIRAVGRTTATFHGLPSPELLGYLCARKARLHGSRSNNAIVTCIWATLRTAFPQRFPNR